MGPPKNTLRERLSRFPGTVEPILSYKCGVVTAVYRLAKPTLAEIAAYITKNSEVFGVDPQDARFSRNILYSVSLLRTERVVRRVVLHDEDVYVIDDSCREEITKIIDPTPSISDQKASAEAADLSPLAQSIFISAPSPPTTQQSPPVTADPAPVGSACTLF